MADTTSQVEEVFGVSDGDTEEPIRSPVPQDEDDLEGAALAPDARRLRWLARRPVTAHLSEAVAATAEGPVPLFDVGDRIVVDISTTHLPGCPWLETLVGHVRSIDDDTGVVTVYDEEGDPRARPVRYVSMRDGLHAFFLAPKRGNPFTATAVRQAAKPEPKPGDPPKRGRGRPKGSLNRPKEVILAEKEARKALKGKRGKRAA